MSAVLPRDLVSKISAWLTLGAAACTIGACDNNHTTPRNHATSDFSSPLNLFTKEDKDFLINRFSGVEIRKLDKDLRNPFKEIFHSDGRWQGEFSQTDVNRYSGRWAIELDQNYDPNICVEVFEVNNMHIKPSNKICRIIYYDDSLEDILLNNLFSGGKKFRIEVSELD